MDPTQTNENAEKVRFTINSPGWVDVLVPDMDRELGLALDILQRPNAERTPSSQSDEFLRGYIRGIRFAYARPTKLLAEYDAAIQKDAEEQEQKEEPTAGSPYAPDPGLREQATP